MVQGHALGPSSVRQIKGCICLYCAAKSPSPLTADTSHVDEEGVSMGPPQLCLCVCRGGGLELMQIKQFVCNFSVCRQIVMGRWVNRRCCKLDFSVEKTDNVFRNLQSFCELQTSQCLEGFLNTQTLNTNGLGKQETWKTSQT